jgi:hypothetical protein
VDRAFDAWLEFDKCAVVGNVGDLANRRVLCGQRFSPASMGVAPFASTQGHAVFSVSNFRIWQRFPVQLSPLRSVTYAAHAMSVMCSANISAAQVNANAPY